MWRECPGSMEPDPSRASRSGALDHYRALTEKDRRCLAKLCLYLSILDRWLGSYSPLWGRDRDAGKSFDRIRPLYQNHRGLAWAIGRPGLEGGFIASQKTATLNVRPS